jgi:hypothetical protein
VADHQQQPRHGGREAEGREASPTAGVINSQSVKTTESGGIRSFDAGKKINGRAASITSIAAMGGMIPPIASIAG